MNPTFGEPSSELGAVPTVPRPGHLGAFAALGADATALIDLLGQAGASGMNERLQIIEGETPHALADWLNLVQHTDAHALVFWQAPAITLANAMAREQPPNEALAQWVGQAEQFLGVVRRNRRRITLVETTLAQSEPDAFIERLSERLALSWATPVELDARPQEHDPVDILIAERAVTSSTRARRLVQELQATSLPIAPDEYLLPDPLTAWQAYHDQKLKKENERLQNDLKQLQEKLKCCNQREEAQKQKESQQTRELADLNEENELLLQQLHHVQEELEAYYLDGRDWDQKYHKAEAARKKLEKHYNSAIQRANVLQQRIEKMRASRSWRITKPLRAGNIFKRKKKN